MKFLLIDDNPIDLMLNEKIVNTAYPSAEILKKKSALEALDYLKTHLHSPPTYILLDIRMPLMDGFGFIEKYQEFAETLKDNTIVLMVSSSIDPVDIKRAETNPLIAGFITKPLSIDKLKNLKY